MVKGATVWYSGVHIRFIKRRIYNNLQLPADIQGVYNETHSYYHTGRLQ